MTVYYTHPRESTERRHQIDEPSKNCVSNEL